MTIQLAPTKPGAMVFSETDLITTLQTHALPDGTLPRNRYQQVRDHHEPSAHLFELRFGTWNQALSAAGLRPISRSPKRAACDPTFSHAAMLAALQAAARATGSTTIRAYDAWRSDLNQPRLIPSAQTIRARFGGWAVAAELAASTHPQTRNTHQET